MNRIRIHPDGCTCDQPWHHRPPAAEHRQARQAERGRLAAFRRKGKTIGNAQRLARVRNATPPPDNQPPAA